MININKIKIGDFYKKIGSNIELKVTNKGTQNGYNFVDLYNDVTQKTQRLIKLKNFTRCIKN